MFVMFTQFSPYACETSGEEAAAAAEQKQSTVDGITTISMLR